MLDDEPFCLVSRSATGALLAANLEARVFATVAEAPIGVPAVVVVENIAEVHDLTENRNRGNVQAVIAWLLPEAALAQLLNHSIPVYIGEPVSRQSLIDLVGSEVHEDLRQDERAITARLTEFERIFAQPAAAGPVSR